VEDKKQLRQPKTLAYFFPLPYELRLPIGDNALPLHHNSNAAPTRCRFITIVKLLQDWMTIWKYGRETPTLYMHRPMTGAGRKMIDRCNII
jgi:hypothetical protein